MILLVHTLIRTLLQPQWPFDPQRTVGRASSVPPHRRTPNHESAVTRKGKRQFSRDGMAHAEQGKAQQNLLRAKTLSGSEAGSRRWHDANIWPLDPN